MTVIKYTGSELITDLTNFFLPATVIIFRSPTSPLSCSLPDLGYIVDAPFVLYLGSVVILDILLGSSLSLPRSP